MFVSLVIRFVSERTTTMQTWLGEWVWEDEQRARALYRYKGVVAARHDDRKVRSVHVLLALSFSPLFRTSLRLPRVTRALAVYSAGRP